MILYDLHRISLDFRWFSTDNTIKTWDCLSITPRYPNLFIEPILTMFERLPSNFDVFLFVRKELDQLLDDF